MPVLKNQKHERFAQAVADGAACAEAYRNIWGCSPSSAETAGPRLGRDIQVMSRIAELRNQADNASKITRAGMVEWLERILKATPNEANPDSDICEVVMTKMGPHCQVVNKMSAAEKLIKMAGWNEPEKLKTEGQLEIVIRKE